jgi:CBS domain-containing protein
MLASATIWPMAARDCPAPKRSREVVAGLSVRDVMIPAPKTLPVTASVADLRALFANDHVRSAVLVDGPAFVGMIDREAVPSDVAGDQPALSYAVCDLPTVGPGDRMTVALERLDEAGALRLAVVDSDGSTLRGLLCLNGQASGFCG